MQILFFYLVNKGRAIYKGIKLNENKKEVYAGVKEF